MGTIHGALHPRRERDSKRIKKQKLTHRVLKKASKGAGAGNCSGIVEVFRL